jgi:putative thioredoxin
MSRAGFHWELVSGEYGDMSTESFMRPGAVDLSALKAKAQAQPSAAGSAMGNGSGFVVDVTEATFQSEVLQRSMSVPVVIDFWAEWCGPCKQLSPTLEKLAGEYEGRFLLAKIDVDANQQLAASAQVQSIPMVIGVVRGQAVPLFAGALPEGEVRKYLDELLKLAATNGVSGRVTPSDGGDQPAQPPHDPRFDKAYEAIERGDYDAASTAYQEILAESPADADAKAGLAQVSLLRRTSGVDPATAQAAAQAAPDDVDAQLLAADLEVAAGSADAAFSRLVATVRAVSGDERERVRTRLIELFEVVGHDDPRVAKARSALASALF